MSSPQANPTPKVYIWKREDAEFPSKLPEGSSVSGDVLQFLGTARYEGTRIQCNAGSKNIRLGLDWIARVIQDAETIWEAPKK
jgi:hypothetical protein